MLVLGASTSKSLNINNGEAGVLESAYNLAGARSVGVFSIRDSSSDVICLIAANGGNIVDILSKYYTVTTNVKDTAGHVNFYVEGGTLYCQNLSGKNKVFMYQRLI